MKRALIIIFIFFVTSNNSLVNAQKDVESQLVVQMLSDFYKAHNAAWDHFNRKDNSVLIRQLDSLKKKNCSIRFQKVLAKEFKLGGLDHDLLTNDYGMDDDAIKTMTITKSTSNSNVYIVSYTYHTLSAMNKPINQKVVLHVTVVKEGGGYKIDSVK